MDAPKKDIKKNTTIIGKISRKMPKKGMQAIINQIMTLNVQGTKIHGVQREVLTKVKGSGLAVMFGGYHYIALDDDGNPLLDRVPKIFKLVLKCLEDRMIYFEIED